MAFEPEDSPDPNPEDDSDEGRTVTINVRKRMIGSRLDKFLAHRFPRMSRTTLQRLIKEGGITVNGLPTKASYEPDKDDLVEVIVPPPPPTDVIPEDIPLDILYEDDFIMAINKRAGIICHPAGYAQCGTIVNGLAFYASTLSRGGDPFRPGIIHRLDKNTTGVMLVAKTDEAHWRLSLQFERRTVRKTYVAVVEGIMNLDGDVIDRPLAAHPTIKDRYVVTGRDTRNITSKNAVTEYKVIERFKGYTYVRMHPRTGRTHQLRVHMSSLGYPMVGDINYHGHALSEKDVSGEGDSTPFISHQCLHARRIEFVHPIKENHMTLEAPLSEKVERVLTLMRHHRALQKKEPRQ